MVNKMAKRSDKRLIDPQIKSVVRTKDQSQEVAIVNICRTGLRFRTNLKFNKGDKLWFELRSSDENTALSLSIKGRVMNDYGQKNDMYDYGVKFFRVLYWYEMNCIHNFVYSTDN